MDQLEAAGVLYLGLGLHPVPLVHLERVKRRPIRACFTMDRRRR